MVSAAVAFPSEQPPGYDWLPDEPVFDPARHHALEAPASSISLHDLGYDDDTIAPTATPFAASSPFRVMSDEGADVLLDTCRRLRAFTRRGGNRIENTVRGGCYRSRFLNPVFAAFAHHISTKFGRKGFLTTIAVTDRDLASEERCIDELVTNCVDGVILLAGRHAEVDGDLTHYKRLATIGMPMVFVNGAPTGIEAPHVRCDEEAGARKAVRHLLDLGHTRIGCLLGPHRYVPTARFVTGYRRTLDEAGVVEPDGAIIETAFTLEGGRAAATRLLDRGITGIIAGNDLMALGAVVASDDGRERASVVGYDGTEFTAYTDPPLTTLRQPFEDMAQLVVDASVSEIDGSSR